MIDQNRDGLIDMQDLREMYSSLGVIRLSLWSDVICNGYLKKAFTMIDQNRDGLIDKQDLKEMFSSLGRVPGDKELEEMLKEATGPLNFTMFLSLFSDKLSGSDPEKTILNAFAMFDEAGTGKLNEEYIKDLLENMGDNFTKEEMRATFKEAPLEGGKFDYVHFSKMLKGSDQEEA